MVKADFRKVKALYKMHCTNVILYLQFILALFALLEQVFHVLINLTFRQELSQNCASKCSHHGFLSSSAYSLLKLDCCKLSQSFVLLSPFISEFPAQSLSVSYFLSPRFFTVRILTFSTLDKFRCLSH